jgi:hypothetical protein
MTELRRLLANMEAADIDSRATVSIQTLQNTQKLEEMQDTFKKSMQELERRIEALAQKQALVDDKETPSSDTIVSEEERSSSEPIAPIEPIEPVEPVESIESEDKEETFPKATACEPTATPSRVEAENDWRPFAIRSLAEPTIPENASRQQTTFSWEFLKDTFKGDVWVPGFYFISADSILSSQAYWVLEEEHDPFLPGVAGQHGAKLSALCRNDDTDSYGKYPDVNNYNDCPVFIRKKGEDGYRYFGQYSLSRWSDKVGYDTMMEHVPDSVLRHFSEQLAAVGRPNWVTKALMDHFWPKLSYDGPMPVDFGSEIAASKVDKATKKLSRALEEYANDLKVAAASDTMKVNLLTAKTIYEAFHKPDADAEPGLRLWWEYLQCTGYDQDFHKMLVSLQEQTVNKIGGDEDRDSIAEFEEEWVNPDFLPKPIEKPRPTPRQLQAEQRRTSPGISVWSLGPTIFTDQVWLSETDSPGPKPGPVHAKQKLPGVQPGAMKEAKTSPQVATKGKDRGGVVPPHLRGKQGQ